jgi:hypothetical protein
VKSIQTKLITLICTLLFITLAIVSTLTYLQVKQQVEENVRVEGQSLVQEKSDLISLYLENFASSIDRYSQDSRVVTMLQSPEEEREETWAIVNEDFQTFNSLIEGIEVETSKVVIEVQSTKAITTEQNTAVKSTEQSFNEIELVVGDITRAIELIKDEVKHMNERKDSVVASIENLVAISQQSAAAAEEVTASTEEQMRALSTVSESAEVLSDASELLTERMNRFKV